MDYGAVESQQRRERAEDRGIGDEAERTTKSGPEAVGSERAAGGGERGGTAGGFRGSETHEVRGAESGGGKERHPNLVIGWRGMRCGSSSGGVCGY